MAIATNSVTLPESIVRAAEVQAKLRGVSLEEWVSKAVAEHLDTPQGAQEFFHRRATGASEDALDRALNAVRSAPPDPGDEL